MREEKSVIKHLRISNATEKKKINKKIHNDIYRVASIYYQISMNVQHRLTTALQMAFALMWRDPFSVNVNQDLQEMEKHARVGQKQNN